MFPRSKEVENAILDILFELGGNGKTKEIYPLMTKKFSITESELHEKLPAGANKWINKIQWARANLVIKKLIKPVKVRGLWEISDRGIYFVRAREEV